jgi:hypothetical protein
MKLKELHPITMTTPSIGTQQLACACGWKGTLWSTSRSDASESSCTRTERALHLLEEMEVAVVMVERG